MINLTEYQILLKEKDWERLNGILGSKISKLAFESTHNEYDLFDLIKGKMDVDHWKNEFNYKLATINTNYGYMYTYFEKLEGYDVYKDPDEDKIAYHFWFSYETEALLARLFTLVDNLYHILDVKYELEIPEGIGYRKDLIKKLFDKNLSLANYLSKLICDQRYKTAQKIRNDFTHNHSPLNITSGVKKMESGNGWTISEGKYKKPKTIVKNIDEFIELLEELTNKCRSFI